MGRNWWKRPCSFIGHAMGTIFHCMILGAVFHNISVFMGTWSQAIKLIYSCAKKRSVWDHNVTHMHSLSLHVSESVTIRSKQRLVGWLQSSWRRGIDISDLGVFPLYPSFLLSPHEDPGTVRDEQSCTCRAKSLATLSGTEVAKLQWHQFFQVSQKKCQWLSVRREKKTMNVHNILYPPLTSPEVFFLTKHHRS